MTDYFYDFYDFLLPLTAYHLLSLPLIRFLLNLGDSIFSWQTLIEQCTLLEGIGPMAFQTDAFYHLSVLFIISIMVFPLTRSSLVALVLAIPALTEIVQFFMPSRVPDFMDAFHGYLGIILAYCLVQMWREIAPVVKKIADLRL